MALALQRAADLSPEPADQARRLVLAAEAAVSAGYPDWAADLAARALKLPAGSNLRERAQHVTGQALTCSGRYTRALEVLLPLARQPGPALARQPGPALARRPGPALARRPGPGLACPAPGGLAWPALGLAATAAYQAGDPASLLAVADTLAALPPRTSEQTNGPRMWALAVTGHVREAAAAVRRQQPGPHAGPHAGQYAGATAWLLDQTTRAIELLRTAPDPPPMLAWAYLDAGRWDEALTLTAGSGVVAATIQAGRGHCGQARALITAALAASPEHGRLLTARARHALALCALADGDYPAAFGHLRQLFDDDGIPYHYHASYLATGDLALAAARAGQRMEGRELLKRIAATLAGAGHPPSPRLRQQLARAHGILADPSTPAAYPGDVADDPAGDQWPFERAQLRLELGEWLRRRRRINQAKPVLSAALASFRTLQARPWAQRAETELRACGIAVPASSAVTAVVKELTPQQRQVIGLAAQGLSNREIAQRLFLSPRTVASHLYRSFPKLGVAGRHQLDAVLTGDGR
jgi:ATP/maltotriose-dependent transcriptional regulator MalT